MNMFKSIGLVASMAISSAVFTYPVSLYANDKSVTHYTPDSVTFHNNMGGSIPMFMFMRASYNYQGIQVRLSGKCMSACVMYLKADNVCVYKGTEFFVHQAYIKQRGKPNKYSPTATGVYYNELPVSVQQIIDVDLDGLTKDFKSFKYSDYPTIAKECK